jgi:hypothetical protein
MLTPLRGTTPEPLVWERPNRFRREFVLRAGPDTVATLRWPGLGGRTAFGETAEGRYRFRLASLWRGTVVIHPGDSDAELAVWLPQFLGGGIVRFSGGRTFRIHRGDFWHRRWTVEDESGRVILTIHTRWHFLRERAWVELEPGAERAPELPALLLLSWYARLRVRFHHRH